MGPRKREQKKEEKGKKVAKAPELCLKGGKIEHQTSTRPLTV